MAGSWLGSFIGSPKKVADSLGGLEAHGIDRVQITPYSSDTFELLAPELCGSAGNHTAPRSDEPQDQ
jgi:hypothetical protein